MSSESKQILPPDFLIAKEFAYDPAGLNCQDLIKESESQDYGALSLKINQRNVKFRVAKITPRKIGQFVVLWKRIGKSPILPYDLADPVDLFIVNVRQDENFGQFIFPKEVLCERGIVSKAGKGGKRAMRVYPPWDIANNSQAKKSQEWQLKYFFKINQNEPNNTKIKDLFI
jgi:hypothetical protein